MLAIAVIFGLVLGVLQPLFDIQDFLELAYAQDLDFENIRESKEDTKLDSKLSELYSRHQEGKEVSQFANTLGIHEEDNKVRVVIELVNETVAIPGDILIESTYENLIQGLVSIGDLKKIASSENVKYVRPPIEPVPLQQDQPTEILDSSVLLYSTLLIIPAVVVPVVYFKRKKKQ